MKYSWQILTILLAVALVVLTVKITILDSGDVSSQTSSVSVEEAVLENIMTRSSVRSYTDQKVENAKIDKMLKAAMAAPTAVNRQPWEFVVVTDREILDKIPSIIKGARMADKSQLAIVVCGVPSKSVAPPLSEFWVQDCSAATENLLLAAHGMGLGAVWCGAYPDSNGRIAQLRELLSLPETLVPLNVIVIGYPLGEPVIKDKWAPEKVHYNKY